ncbi:MAG TPA: hypothetical protein VJJ52_06505 [Candidatus Nanoarchaeia archaeon]|nr:hypothetical protein [Candidatus Nanoarchaeia archaeon]
MGFLDKSPRWFRAELEGQLIKLEGLHKRINDIVEIVDNSHEKLEEFPKIESLAEEIREVYAIIGELLNLMNGLGYTSKDLLNKYYYPIHRSRDRQIALERLEKELNDRNNYVNRKTISTQIDFATLASYNERVNIELLNVIFQGYEYEPTIKKFKIRV